MPPSDQEPRARGDEFARAAAAGDRSIVAELVQFIAENKAWWLIPIFVVFGLVGVVLALGGSGLAPFLYVLW